ncbi:MAG: hypothetical protein LC775_11905 [Acidobacteria bacterium]|nr:hypothetical protein [Acidobacteriota bacterium]
MTDFVWGFILGLLVTNFVICLTLALVVNARADADDLADWRELGPEDDWVWIG